MDRDILMLIDKLPDLAVILSTDGTFEKVNRAFINCLQYTAEELEGRLYSEIIASKNDAEVQAITKKLQQGEQLSCLIHTLHKKDGSQLSVSWSFTSVANVIFCIGRSVDQAANTGQQLLQKEHLFQALVENSFDLLAVTDINGYWTYVSESLATLLHRKPKELIGQLCFDYIHPEDLPQLAVEMETLLKGQRKLQGPPYRFKNGYGEWLWMEAIVTNRLDDPEITGIIITGRDISDRIRAEKNAKEVQLLEALKEGEEKERSRISRDLHDEISAMVVAAKMHFATLTHAETSVEGNKEYQQGIRLLDEAARQIRNTSHNLMPEILLEKGLNKALEYFLNSVTNCQLQIRYVAVGNDTRYSASFELSLYRILQELVNNIVKHSKATEAIVQLSYQPQVLSVTIEDNGIGFEEPFAREGTGLRSIRKRVAVMNGDIEIQSGPQEGTNIYLEFNQPTLSGPDSEARPVVSHR
ncbi:PAS domain-containing sensor histidine kinase [Flavitalea antarctica]